MEFVPTSVPDVIVIKPRVHGDPRGFFLESWHQQRFAEAGIDATFVQDNHSRSARHVLRGLHYQVQHSQGKLIRVVSGTVFDVAVDMRKSSATFGRWAGAELSAESAQMMWVPPGFAHGFVVLSESADVVYKCTDFWAPQYERSLLWNDVDLDIDWRLPPGVQPVTSAKDSAGIRFKDAEYFQ